MNADTKETGMALQDALLFREIEKRRLLVNVDWHGTVSVRDCHGNRWYGATLREVMKEICR